MSISVQKHYFGGPRRCTELWGTNLWGPTRGADYILQLLPSAFMSHEVLKKVPGTMVWRWFGHTTACYYGIFVVVAEIIICWFRRY